MKWNKNLLWVSALIGMMVIGSAITVTSVQDAITALSDKPIITPLEGEVHSCEKTVTTIEEANNAPYSATYSTWYQKDGVKTREGVKSTEVANCSEATIKAATAPLFEAEYATITAKYNKTYNSVTISPAGEGNKPLTDTYDYIKKTWNSIAQVEQ